MKKFLRDWQFYLCLAFGITAWSLFSFFLPLREEWSRVWSDPLTLLSVALLYPILEEIVFRGLLLEFVARKTQWRIGLLSAANLLTSLAFVAAHLIYQPWQWALARQSAWRLLAATALTIALLYPVYRERGTYLDENTRWMVESPPPKYDD